MPLNCGAGEGSWKSLGQQEIKPVNLKGINPEYYWKDWCWSWSSNILVIWFKQMTHWKNPWCWERLRAEGEEGIRGWDGWIASLKQWTWTWANSRRRWGPGRPGVLQSMGSQRVRHNWGTEQQQQRDNKQKMDSGKTEKAFSGGNHWENQVSQELK